MKEMAVYEDLWITRKILALLVERQGGMVQISEKELSELDDYTITQDNLVDGSGLLLSVSRRKGKG